MTTQRLAGWYRQRLKHDFAFFIERAFSTIDPGTEFLSNWHINLIAEYLEAVRRGELTRLIINMPPRSLKSVCVSVAWPAFLLGHNPESRIIAASYSQSLALKHSTDCRLLLKSSWYQKTFPKTLLAKDQNQKHKFATSRQGFRFATSVGGSLTGEGGNFLIIDDPINPLQAQNANWRAHVNRWFDHTFASRLNDKKKGAIVLVMHRLHENDLAGHLLGKGGWEHLSLPAVATQKTEYGFKRVRICREKGAILHEERENSALIARAKNELGSYAFASQYQQSPMAEDGNMLRVWWFKRYAQAPEMFSRVVQSWDTAIKSKEENDASVCLTFGEQEGRSYLLDVQVFRAEYPELKRAFAALAEKWHPQAILIEDKGSGQQLLQDVRQETVLPVISCNPRGNKMARFAAVSAMIEAGRLFLPQAAVWLADFEKELLTFPAGNHDDQVDALTQYLGWLRDSKGFRGSLRPV